MAIFFLHQHIIKLLKFLLVFRFPISKHQPATSARQSRSPVRRGTYRSNERQALDFDSSGATSSASKLTQQALADHDRRYRPMGLGERARQGPASESELDTLVEMQGGGRRGGNLRGLANLGGQGIGGHRRTSSSSPVRLRGERIGSGHGYQFQPHLRSRSPDRRDNGLGRDAGGLVNVRNNIRPRQAINQDNDGGFRCRNSGRSPQRVGVGMGITRPQYKTKRSYELHSPEDHRQGPRDGTEVSVDQSRYSVTDYFQKYHSNSGSNRKSDPQSLRSTSYPRPERPIDAVRKSAPVPKFATSSEISAPVVRNYPKPSMPVGHIDQTISAIDDNDNMSSVSMNSVTTANTVDERKFRSGIANLDANIARLQQALQKTKSMLS